MKKPQKYQNKVAYKVKFHKDKEELQKRTPLNNLCDRCFEVLQWKLTFGKYKKMTNVSKCVRCNLKVIFKSYRSVCEKCSTDQRVCSKCNEVVEKFHEYKDKIDQAWATAQKLKAMKETMATFKERSRRKIMRLIKENNVDFVDSVFVYKTTGEAVEVQFKNSHQKSDSESEDICAGDENNHGSGGELDDSEGSYKEF